MSDQKKTKGKCVYCGKSFSKSGMTRHLKSCAERSKQIALLGGKLNETVDLFHLHVYDAYSGDYWMHLEMSGSAKLKELDSYLRAIWLECCGHMSEFSYKRWEDEIPQNSIAENIFEPGLEIFHMYDFGTTSETKIKVIDKRKGISHTRYPIFLMSRNDVPEFLCKECGAKAEWLCIECMYENDDCTFCDKHIESHPHDEYGEPMPLVNSPRIGMCGYDGPAEPQY